MNYYLAKTEPQDYSIDDLKRENATRWNGIKNPQSASTLKQMRPGDRVFIYHSGTERAITGLAEVISEPQPDPDNTKSFVVDLRYLSHLSPPTALAEVKSTGAFASWALVRQPRLSTMPVPPEFLEWIRGRYPGASI